MVRTRRGSSLGMVGISCALAAVGAAFLGQFWLAFAAVVAGLVFGTLARWQGDELNGDCALSLCVIEVQVAVVAFALLTLRDCLWSVIGNMPR